WASAATNTASNLGASRLRTAPDSGDEGSAPGPGEAARDRRISTTLIISSISPRARATPVLPRAASFGAVRTEHENRAGGPPPLSTPSGARRGRPKVRRCLDMKKGGERIAVLTAYEVFFAGIVQEGGVDIILVGDSLAQVVLGHDSTLPVSVD